jgi:hypothetical protein
MGIAGVEPLQLAPTVGTTGSGSTDSPAPSPTIADLTTPTRFNGSSSATAVDSTPPIDNDIASSTPNIDIGIDVDTTPATIVGIAVPAFINAMSLATTVDITGSTIVDIASPSIADLTPARDFDSPATRGGARTIHGYAMNTQYFLQKKCRYLSSCMHVYTCGIPLNMLKS